MDPNVYCNVLYTIRYLYSTPGCNGDQTDCEDIPKTLPTASVAAIAGVLLFVNAMIVALIVIIFYRYKINKKKRQALRE